METGLRPEHCRHITACKRDFPQFLETESQLSSGGGCRDEAGGRGIAYGSRKQPVNVRLTFVRAFNAQEASVWYFAIDEAFHRQCQGLFADTRCRG